jgi:hypothetical protein
MPTGLADIGAVADQGDDMQVLLQHDKADAALFRIRVASAICSTIQ